MPPAKREKPATYPAVYVGKSEVYVPDLGRVLKPGDDCEFPYQPDSPLFETKPSKES